MSKCKEYQVSWTIEVDAENYQDAAEQALEIQRDIYSEALSFKVRCLRCKKTSMIDLLENSND